MRSRLTLSLLALSACMALGSDNWPGFRGPSADGRSDSKGVVTGWSEKDNIAWKTGIHGKGWSSPVVLGNQVWVTTADEVMGKKEPPKRGAPPANPVKEVSFFAVCVDRDTGKILHDIKLGTESDPQYCHPFNSYASPTPFIEQGRLYAHFGSHGTWCVDTASGKVLWERKDLKCDHFRGPGSSAVVYGDLLYLIFDGFDLQYVTALDKSTGKTVWKTDRDIKYSSNNGDYKKAYATPVMLEIGGKPQLVCPSAECTIAYDPKSGAELWRIAHGGMNGSARAVMGGGLLYLTSGHSGNLLAVKPGGSGMLSKDAVIWRAAKNVPSRPSIVLDGGLIYMVSDSGFASCLDAATGKVYYTERLDGEFTASPVLVDGNIFFCSQNGKTFVISRGKGFDLVAENRLGDGFMASPAVAGGALFLRSRSDLYRVGKK